MQQTQLGIREYIAIVLFCLITKVTDDTPVHFYSILSNAAWMATFISAILAIIPICILMRVVLQYDNMNLIDVIFELFGKYVGWCILFLLWGFQTFYLAVDSAIQKDIIATMYFPNTFPIIIYILLIVIITYGAWKGIQAIGSTALIVLIFIQVSFLFSLLLTFGQGQSDFLYPFFGPGEWKVIKASLTNFSMYADILFFFILVDALPNKKDFKKGTWIAFTIIVVEITLSMITYLMLFDYKSINLLSYPYHEVIRFISLGFITNIEALFFPFWLVATFIRFTAYLYLNIVLFGRLFKIEKFHYLAPIITTLALFIGNIPDNPPFVLPQLKEKIIHYFSPIFIILPVAMWIAFKVKGGAKSRESKQS